MYLAIQKRVCRSRIPFGELSCHELGCTALNDVGIEASLELVEERLLAPQITRLQQPGADCQIGFGLTEAFFDGAGRLPDLESKVPKQIEKILDDLLGMRGLLVRQQEQEVDVGIRGELAAPIATHCDDRQPLARSRIRKRVDRLGHEIEQRAD